MNKTIPIDPENRGNGDPVTVVMYDGNSRWGDLSNLPLNKYHRTPGNEKRDSLDDYTDATDIADDQT